MVLRRNFCECKSGSPCESPKLNKISEKNEEHCDTCMSTSSNPIQSDNECQFTKLARQKSRVKGIQIDSVIQEHADERMHLINTEVRITSRTHSRIRKWNQLSQLK